MPVVGQNVSFTHRLRESAMGFLASGTKGCSTKQAVRHLVQQPMRVATALVHASFSPFPTARTLNYGGIRENAAALR